MKKTAGSHRLSRWPAQERAERVVPSPPERKKDRTDTSQKPVSLVKGGRPYRAGPGRALTIRLSEGEREELVGAAGGVGLSVWARAVLLREARKT